MMKLPTTMILLGSVYAGLIQAEEGKNIVLQGNQTGATACSVCHGENGAGQAAAGFPRLAGLPQEYLEKQLRDFKAQRRNNPMMAPIAASLSDEEIKAVAAYFSKQAPTTPSKSKDETANKTGRDLAQRGAWDKGVPACFRCHGSEGQGVAPHMPAIAGQHQSYLQAQLQAFKAGQRSNDPLDLMSTFASRLSDEEITAVAAYLANFSAKSAN